jgi:hypothetical protein
MTRSPMQPEPNITDWLKDKPITLVKLAGPYESKDDDGWVHDAYVLRLVWADQTADKRTSPEVKYRMGVGHRKAKVGRWATQEMQALPIPPLPDVLDSLISDASCYDNARNYADFAGDLGYDPDSIKGEATYRACGEVLDWLTTFVGGRAVMEHLMYEIERL